MPYSMTALPPTVQNKSDKAKQAFLKAYDSAIDRGLTEEESLFSALAASTAADKPKEGTKKALQPIKPALPSHLAAVLQKRTVEPPKPLPEAPAKIKQAFLGKNALVADPDRSLVSASWDDNARLQLQFDDGAKIVTEPVPVSEYIEQHVAITANPIVPYIQFDTTTAIPSAVGQLTWNNTDGTLDLGLGGGNVTLQIGQEQVTHVYNNTANDFSDLQVLRITGSQGQRLTGALAQANSEANSSSTYAVVTEPILKNQVGFANTFGLVRNVNTSAFPEGAALYLSPTVAGAITHVKPTAPSHVVMIGWCVRSHAVQGSIYVHVQNGFELEELHNVLITNVQNGHILKYDSATSLWKNVNPAAASGVTTGSFFQKVNLVAGTPLTISHNLALIDKDAFTINTVLAGKVVSINCSSVDANSLQLTSAVAANQVSVTIIGVIA